MKRLLIIPAIISVFGFSSCKNDKAASSTVTQMNIRLTDAPGAYDALYISVKEVQVITSEGSSVLPINAGKIDILKFRMGKDTLLASQDIPAGKLQEIRLVLNETGNEVVIGGKSYPLTTPSAQSSGLKLKVEDDLTGGVAYTLKLDFDAAKSVVKTGNDKYILKPVIRVIPQAVSGALTGIVTPAASAPKVYAILGTDTIGAVADTTGKFFFSGMKAGIYKVNIQPVSPYVSKSIENAEVVNGSVKNLGSIVINQ